MRYRDKYETDYVRVRMEQFQKFRQTKIHISNGVTFASLTIAWQQLFFEQIYSKKQKQN